MRACITAIVLLLVACGSSSDSAEIAEVAGDDADAEVGPDPSVGATPEQPVAPTTPEVETTPTSEPTPTATTEPIEPPPDPAVVGAAPIEELYASPPQVEGWPIEAGTWVSDSFSTPLAFDLPVDGHITQDAAGALEILVGDAADPVGFLHIVEPLAVNAATGPVPIAAVNPETIFRDSEVHSQETVELTDRTLSVTDATLPSSSPIARFATPCARVGERSCVSPFTTLSGFVFLEVGRTHRFVSQTWGDGAVIVVATAAGDDATPGGDEFRAHANAIAASLVEVQPSDSPGRRWIAALGNRVQEVPAGQYVARVGETALAFDIDSTVPSVSVNAVRSGVLGFAAVEDEDWGSGWLRFFAFDGFGDLPSPVDSPETPAEPGAPPSAEEFAAELGERLVVVDAGSDSIGGVDATWIDATAADGEGENCALSLGWSNPAATCVRWAAFPTQYWLLQPSDVVSRHWYIEDEGLLVVITPQPGFTVADVVEDLGALLDGLRITAVEDS